MEKLADSQLFDNVETVYSEVLYSVIHKITHLDGLSVSNTEKVFDFLRKAFQLSEEQHKQILDAVKQKNPPEVTLNLNILEARSLKPKDVDGLCDPYCSVCISSDKKQLLNTTTKLKTLEPVWNEELKFKIKDVDEDVLQIEVWDFDPNQSFTDKMAQFGDVVGYRGFGKLLKEIAGSSDSTHDFVGLLNISLKVIPLSGLESWFSLKGKDTSKSQQRGELKLSLMLSAIQPENQFTLQESVALYKQLLTTIIEYEMQSDPDWCGQLPESASLALCHLAVHRGLQPWMKDMCLWSVYSSVLQERNLDFELLQKLMQHLCQTINNNQMTAEEEQLMTIFWAASEKFVPAALTSIRHIRNTPELCKSSSQFSALLQCLKGLKELDNELSRIIFSDFSAHINEAIMMGASDWWIKSVGNCQNGDDISNEDRLVDAIRICQLLNSDLETLSMQNEIFLRELEISSFNSVYQYYDAQLCSLSKPIINSVNLMSSIHITDEQIFSLAMQASVKVTTPENPTTADENMKWILSVGANLLEMYLGLQHFQKLGNGLLPSEKEKLELNNYYNWFLPLVSSWFVISKYKAMTRIGKAIALDSLQTVDSLIKFSSSAVDTVTVFYQIKKFWDQLAWPDTEAALTFVAKIVDDINQCSSFYVDAIGGKLEQTFLLTPSTEVFQITQPVFTAINSILHIRNSIEPLVEEMGLSKLCQVLQESHNEAGLVSTVTKDTLIQNTIDNINARMDNIFCTIAQNIVTEITKRFAEVYQSAFNENQQHNLISYMDDILSSLSARLDADTFERNLHLIYEFILHSFYQFITIDMHNQQPSVFHQWDKILETISELFYGTELVCQEASDEVLSKVKRYLKLHGSESCDLVHQYQLERMKTDNRDCNLGTITIRALFVQDELIIEILNGRNLKSLDSNGNSDPYVDFRLMPASRFPELRHKTQTKKKTLFPLYDEKFTCVVPQELQTSPDHFILLTVVDWDMLSANDFMGEAYLSFQQILRGDMPTAIVDMDQIHLNLSKPPNTDSEFMQILKSREDKVASHFVKKEFKKTNKE